MQSVHGRRLMRLNKHYKKSIKRKLIRMEIVLTFFLNMRFSITDIFALSNSCDARGINFMKSILSFNFESNVNHSHIIACLTQSK